MGRGRRKLLAKRRKKMFQRIEIRKKMGKPIFFTLTNCKRRLNGFSNKYNYKANMHGLAFVETRFYNVKFQSSIITKCSFKDSELRGVDFFNCNMKNTTFKNTKLENIVFYNCNLKGASFINVQFKEVRFICTNIDCIKEMNREKIKIYKTYQTIDMKEETEKGLLELSSNVSLYEAKVLHVNRNKLNHWALRIISEKYGLPGIEHLERVLRRKIDWDRMFTIYSYQQLLENTFRK